jgi:hypothetical protein
MHAADLTLEDREALAESLNPLALAREREAADLRAEAEANVEAGDLAELAALIPQAEADLDEALLALTVSMSAHIEARARYDHVSDAGRAVAARARKADIPGPVLRGFPELMLSNGRGLLNEWQTVTRSGIR